MDGMNVMNSMPSTNADTASIFSDVELSSEGIGIDENGEPLFRGAYSSKAAQLASEIASMEQLVARLEERNRWLTARLFTTRRQFIEKHFMKSSTTILTRVMDAWREAMNQLRVESQLEKQTAALDQCQQVAKELGAALAQEQSARKRVEEANRTVRAELERVLAFNEGLQQQGEDANRRGKLLERQLEEAENKIQSCKRDAIAIVENVELWEQTKADPQKLKQRSSTDNEDFLGRSERVRSEARDVIQKVSNVLVPVARGRGTPSPDRERERPGRAVGALSSISRYDVGDSFERGSPPGGMRQPSPKPLSGSKQRALSEQRARAQSNLSQFSSLSALEGAGYAVSASTTALPATQPTTPVAGSRFGAWQYESSMLPLGTMSSDVSSPPQQQDNRGLLYSGGSLLQAPGNALPLQTQTYVLGSSSLGSVSPALSPPVGRPSAASGSVGSPASTAGFQTQQNNRGEMLEPWWCVRRVNPNGTTTVTPQNSAT